MFPGPSMDTPFPTKRSASVQASGADGRAGWYGAGGNDDNAIRVATFCHGLRLMSTIAWNVSAGAGLPGGVAAPKSAGHCVPGLAMQAAIMLASELNVSRVDVSLPLGEPARTGLMSPLERSTRLRTMPAAFWSPGARPAMTLFSVNCVIA
jgi:hypothetical protein